MASPPLPPSAAARKRKRVPDVLWKLFGKRARTLAETIIAFVPTPPETTVACPCRRRRCLYCSGDETMSFLVRSTDSKDYCNLLNGCFVVVSEDAPPLTFVDPQRIYSQQEIVRRSIEILRSKQPSSSNLICCNYDKERRSSATVDELTSLKWTVLLRRVGDLVMTYLLMFTSIFLPLPGKKHHQISGSSIGHLCSKFSGFKSRSQHHPLGFSGDRVKRKRADGDELPRKKLRIYNSGAEFSINSISFASNNGSTCAVELPHQQSKEISKQNTVRSKKHTNLYHWRRQEKRKQLAVQGTPSLIPCGGNSCTTHKLSLFSSSSQNDMNLSRCFCCSVFRNEPRMKRNAEIDRKHMFYRLENSSSMLPMKHIVYTLKPNATGASSLFNNIFEIFGPDKNAGILSCCQSKNGCPTDSSCLYHSVTTLLKRLIRKSQNCKHAGLLDKHCCTRSSYQDLMWGACTRPQGNDSANHLSMSRRDGVESEETMVQVANSKRCELGPVSTTAQVESIKCCVKSQIVSFIWAICRRIVPLQLLGEPSNWRVLRNNISKFIQLRRYEKFSLKECIHKLKISKFPIFSNKYTGCSGLHITDIARNAIFECWIFWFFTNLVSPLVQANFYVTESDHEKQEVLYYCKSTWEKLMTEGECRAEYRLLNYKAARDIIQNRSFGFSRARLRPKHNGFRMLSNLRAPSRLPVNPTTRIYSNRKSHRKPFGNHRVKYQYFKSVNTVLHDVHVVLKGLSAKKPEQLGSSVFDYNDVYKKLVHFLFHLKNGSTSLPDVFIVVSDVSKAFDSVNHGKLLSVMKDVIIDDDFTLERFTQVSSTRKFLKIDEHQMLENKDIVAASTRIRSRLRAQSLCSIVIKEALTRKVRKEKINSILKEHIMRNIVLLGNKFYFQRIGIPQGSVLSGLLCSLYYGHMERNVLFPFLEKSNADSLANHHSLDVTSASGGCHKMQISARGGDYLLLRFIDDFLFISTSKKQASMFFSRLERGVRDYNCFMNKEKYGLNFTMDNGQGFQSNRLYSGKDGISFHHWSGLLVNCSTLEIQADYTRYLNSPLSSSLTVCCQGKVGQNLREKLKSYLRPKCHPIFYDSNINSPGVVRLNIYQAFLLCAMKFICHLSNLSVLPEFRPKFCINAIESSLRYMNRLIKRKMYSFRGDPSFRPQYNVEKKEVIWLGLYAYSRVLQKKESRHKNLLRLFRRRLKTYDKVENMSSELKYAVEDSQSSALWSIKY